MEKIVIISDIHGNITDFKTVLEDIHKRWNKYCMEIFIYNICKSSLIKRLLMLEVLEM